MKKLIKILGYTILSIFLIVIILVITASLSQNKIVDITLKKISQNINALIEIDDASFTLIKRFPYATVELSGVRIGAEKSEYSNSKNISNKDILNIKRVFILVKSVPLFRGEYEIDNIEIDNAGIYYKVDSLGSSNIDFLLDSKFGDTNSDTTSSFSGMNLKKVRLTNTFVYYADDSLQFAANIFIPKLDLKGKLANDKFTGSTEGDMKLTKCEFANTTLNRMEEASVHFNLNYQSDTLEIKMLEASTEGAKIKVSGKVAISDTLFSNLAFELRELQLGILQKYAPDELIKEYGIESVTGLMSVSGTVIGYLYDSVMPAVNLFVECSDASFVSKNYPIVRKISFNGEISNGNERNNKTTSANFKSFHAETETSTADLSFSLVNMEKQEYQLKSKLKINIAEFRKYIPDSIVQNISGEIFADISTKGQMPDSIDDNYINHFVNNTFANVDFSNFQIEMDSIHVNDLSGEMIYHPKNLKVNNLNLAIPEWNLQFQNSSVHTEFTGKVTQPEELELNLNSFYTETLQGRIRGSGKIKNLKLPDFEINAQAKIDLAELKPFIPGTLIKDISGNLEAEISSFGKLNLDSIENQSKDILFKQSKINLSARNVSVSMPDTLQDVAGLNAEFEMDKGAILISKMNGIAAGIEFSIDSSTVWNIYEAIVKNRKETLKAYVNLELGAIDYSTLIPLFGKEEVGDVTNGQNITESNYPAQDNNENQARNFLFEVKGKIATKSFRYNKIFLEDVSAKFNLCDSVYIVDQFKTKAFDGFANSSLRYSLTKNNKQIINVKNHTENMDIHKLFYAFNNFGYDSLMSYENISGIFSSDINTRFVFEADSLVSNDIRILGNFKLKNGKLINYEPAMEVSKFTGIKELDNIEMKTLECNIFMFKNKIYVPITKIVSSSMDLSTFGMQSLGDDYEYHIQMKLGEILKGKSQKLFERQINSSDEISEDEEDKNTIKLIYGYIDGKKKLGFATKKAQKQMALKIQVQQKMLELIFHPTLVSFETGVK